ncbi:hypothetical protein BH11VER1_BH11VER1_15880 [soil metagenome]
MEPQNAKTQKLTAINSWFKTTRWVWFLPLIFGIIPLVMAARFSCSVPKADHWFVITVPYLNYVNGGSWWDFIHSPGNDSRHDVPKLLHYLLIKFTHWDLTLESMTCVFIALATCAMLLEIWRNHEGAALKNWLLSCLSVLLLLSPLQWMNWTWGIQICYAMVVIGTVGVVAVFHASWSLPVKSFCGACCASAAAMSFINGWCAWLLGLVLLLVECQKRQWRIKDVLLGLGIWFTGFVLTLWWFLADWPEKISDNHTGFLQRALLHPLQDMHFVLQILGAPFSECWFIADRPGRNALQEIASPWIGAFTLLLLFCVMVRFWHQRKSVSWQQASPWICLLLWGLANAAAIALARTDNGLSSPFQSRYPAYILWYHLGLLGLLFLWNGGLAVFLRGLLILIMVWGGCIGAFQGWRDAVRDGKRNQFMAAAAALRHAFIEPMTLDAILPSGGETIVPYLDQLDKLGLLNVFTVKSSLVSESHLETAHSYEGLLKEGRFEENGVFLRGWALNRDSKDAADVVVVSCTVKGEAERWLGIATHQIRETKLSAKMKSRELEGRIGWAYEPLTGKETCSFSDRPLNLFRSPLPKGNLTFRAYVFDPIKGVFYPLKGSVVLDRP